MNKEIEIRQIAALKSTGNKIYDNYVLRFNSFLNGRPVTMDLVIEFLEEMKKSYSASTLGTMKAALKQSIIKSLDKRNARDLMVLAMLDISFKQIKVSKPDKKVYSEKVLSEEEIRILIDALPIRLSLIVKTLACSAMRISELTGIKIKDCERVKEVVYIKILGKGSKERRIFISYSLFKEIMETFQGKEYLFQNYKGGRMSRQYIFREINKYGKEVLDRNIGCHTFRHSFITNLLKAGKSLKAVSLFAGHADSSVTSSMYDHNFLTFEDIEDMFDFK